MKKNNSSKFIDMLFVILIIGTGFICCFCRGIAVAAGPPTKIVWKYEFTEREDIVVSKKDRLQQMASTNGSVVELKATQSGGERLSTVTIKGQGTVDDF